MPCAVDYILEGLAKNLELERELGNFAFEFDRAFLASLPKKRGEGDGFQTPDPGARNAAAGSGKGRTPDPESPRTAGAPVAGGKAVGGKRFDFVFLHHGPVRGDDCVTMMAKLTAAMKQTPESAPIVFTGEKPPAKIYVVLGLKALAKWYEGVSLSRCGWFKDVDSEVLLVYSPEDIYRFGPKLTPAMFAKKKEMWTLLQAAMGKV